MLWRGFLATCMGVLTTHWLMQIDPDLLDFARARFGTHRDFGLYTDDEANYSRVFWWYFWEVPVFALMGALGGLLGALFVKINVKITRFASDGFPWGNASGDTSRSWRCAWSPPRSCSRSRDGRRARTFLCRCAQTYPRG